MKAVIQRVTNAKVILNEEIPVSIEHCICVLVGFHKDDTIKDLEYIVKKILSVKLFDDENKNRWKKSVVDKELEVLIISQYTIYNGWKGNTPDFHKTMGGDKSQEFYTKLIELARELYVPEKVKDGVFGIYRQIYIENDGPVTFEVDSPPSCREEVVTVKIIELLIELINYKIKYTQNVLLFHGFVNSSWDKSLVNYFSTINCFVFN